jgi:hypothetical protein
VGSVRPLPQSLGELIGAVHAFAAATGLLLRAQRVAAAAAAAGEAAGAAVGAPLGDDASGGASGGVADVSLERAGLWSAGVLATWICVDPHKAKLWDVEPARCAVAYPIPTMNAVVTADGVCVQVIAPSCARTKTQRFHLLPSRVLTDLFAVPEIR